MSDINPEVKEIKYGKKELKTLTLYPLSIGDQFTVSDIITKIVQELITAKNEGLATTDYTFLTAAMDLLKENIGKILVLISGLAEEDSNAILNELTNSQLMEMIDIIWTINYEPNLKKGQSLIERGKKVFGSSLSSQNLSSAINNTTLNTSIEEPLKKEDSPSPN